jgi:hypothetical protein
VKYRIVTAGTGFVTQCRFKYWPFWNRVFDPGFNYFKTIDEAENAIKILISRRYTNGRVVKQFDDAEVK